MKMNRKSIKHVRPTTRHDRPGSLANGNGHATETKNGKTHTMDASAATNGSSASNAEVDALAAAWRTESRWQGITRGYSAEKVLRLRGTMKIEHTIADKMSRKLWDLLNTEPYISALGALTGNQAVQMAQ